VRFLYPNNTEIKMYLSDVMMMEFTANIRLEANNSGMYRCEILDSSDVVADFATFEFSGTPSVSPTTPIPTIPIPTLPPCASTQGRDIALGVVFSLVGVAMIIAVIAVIIFVLYRFTHLFDPLKNKIHGASSGSPSSKPLKEEDSPRASRTASD
jgi:hypothetical protein